jgi:hypothetical protein
VGKAQKHPDVEIPVFPFSVQVIRLELNVPGVVSLEKSDKKTRLNRNEQIVFFWRLADFNEDGRWGSDEMSNT